MAAPCPRLHAGQASVLSAALMASGSAWSAPPPFDWPLHGGPARAVRNTNPERAATPDHAQWPIYYPRPAHAGAAEAGPPTPEEALLREFLDLHTAMEYEQAADVALRLQAMAPDAAIAHYNRACALARLCRVDEAMAALSRSIDCGWTGRRHLQLDPDLEILRREPRFRALLERIPAATALRLEHSQPPVEAPRAAVALIHRGRVVMQWDDAPGAALGAGDVLRIASETWRQRASPLPIAAAPGAGVEAVGATGVEPLVVFCASPELARELAQLVEAGGSRARLLVQTPAGTRTPNSEAASPRSLAGDRGGAATGGPASAAPPPARGAA